MLHSHARNDLRELPLKCEVKLEVWDSPNSAGVVIDAVRCIKLALDQGIAGPLIGPASYFMKSPPQQFTDHEAHERTAAFIRENARPSSTTIREPDAKPSATPASAPA